MVFQNKKIIFFDSFLIQDLKQILEMIFLLFVLISPLSPPTVLGLVNGTTKNDQDKNYGGVWELASVI